MPMKIVGGNVQANLHGNVRDSLILVCLIDSITYFFMRTFQHFPQLIGVTFRQFLKCPYRTLEDCCSVNTVQNDCNWWWARHCNVILPNQFSILQKYKELYQQQLTQN